MQRKEKAGISWLEFDLLADIPSLTHGVFLRHGGHSTGPYSSLNLGGHVGDCLKDVQQNISDVSSVLKIPQLIWSEQIHSKIIHNCTLATKKGMQGDGLTTSSPGLGLMVMHADCQAAIFYDPIQGAVANVHAGWRGSVQNIYLETICQMKKDYGSNPANLLVCISPSLGPQDAQFINYENELPEEFWEFQVAPTYFDFWAISHHQLIQGGILPHHIEMAGISTYAHPADYFSYRRQRITGRNGTLVAIR